MTTPKLPRTALAALLALLATSAATQAAPAAPPGQETPAGEAASEETPAAKQAEAPAKPAKATAAERASKLRADLERWTALAGAGTGEDREVALDQVRRTRDALDVQLDLLAESDDADGRALAATVSREEVDTVQGELDELGTRLADRRAAPPEDEEAGEPEGVDRLEADELDALDRLSGHVVRLRELEHPEAEELTAALVEQLEDRAEMAVARLELRVAKLELLEDRLEDVSDDRKAALEDQIADLEVLRDSAADTFTLVTADLADLGVKVDAELKNARLEATGELGVEDVDLEVVAGLVQRWGHDVRETVAEEAPQWIFRAFLFVTVLVVFWGLSRLVRKLVRRAVNSSRVNFSSLLRDFFEHLAGKLVLFFGLLIALSQIGIELGPVLAGLGIAGFVLGFALQDTLSNFASGLMILAYRPYDVNDVVSVAGVTGKVFKMSMVSTTILTFDNQQLVVPNSKIWGDVITNITARDTRRVDMTFGIGYQDDIPRAEEILAEVVSAHPKVLAEPAPTIKLSGLGDSSVDFVVRPWAKTEDYWDVNFDITRTVKLRFDEEGISIPFPQRDVHVHYTERDATLVPARPPVDPQPVDDPAPALAAEGRDGDGGR